MGPINLSDELLTEIEEFIDVGKEQVESLKIPLLYDGNQFSLKIPKATALKIGLEEGDHFEFLVSSKVKGAKFEVDVNGKLVKE